jgi:hypothetical protein
MMSRKTAVFSLPFYGGRKSMTMTAAERRNERDRARHTKATRVTLYELGIMIAALNVADKLVGIGTKYTGVPLWVAMGIGLIAATVMFCRRKKDSELLASLDDELKDAAQTEGSS